MENGLTFSLKRHLFGKIKLFSVKIAHLEYTLTVDKIRFWQLQGWVFVEYPLC